MTPLPVDLALADSEARASREIVSEREKFEAWLEGSPELDGGGNYVMAHISGLWDAWQARAALEGKK